MKDYKRMQTLIKKYEAARTASDEAEAAWEQEPESAELEAAFDQAYSEEFEACAVLVKEIVNFTEGQVDATTARRLITTRLDDIKKLIETV